MPTKEQKRRAEVKKKKAEAEAQHLDVAVKTVNYWLQRARADGREEFVVTVEPMRLILAALEKELDALKDWKREAKKKKKALKQLSGCVSSFLVSLDTLMNEPESYERGRKFARIANTLDRANDEARYFELGVDHRKDEKKHDPLVSSQGYEACRTCGCPVPGSDNS